MKTTLPSLLPYRYVLFIATNLGNLSIFGILLQTKLHDTVCKRRRAATIATHDLLKLTPPLSFICQPAESISLTPLGWSEPVSCKKFLGHLEANKPDKTQGGGGKKGAAKQVDPAAAALSK